MRHNTENNFRRILSFLEAEDSDIIALQEVPERFYTLLEHEEEFLNKYTHIKPPYFTVSPYDTELLLIKKKFNPELHAHVPLPGTGPQNRHYVSATIQVGTVTLVIGTAHLQSVFFTASSTATKSRQLEYIVSNTMARDAYKEENGASLVVMGDMNLTGGEELERENATIKRLDLVDIWKSLHAHADANERNENEAYRKNDVTWDAENPLIDVAEYHRPDRIFLRTTDPGVRFIKIDRIITFLSDHYPLKATLSIKSFHE